MTRVDLTTRDVQGPQTVQPKHGWAIHHSAGPRTFETAAEEIAHLDWIDTFHREKRGWETGIAYQECVFESGNSYRTGDPGSIRTHIKDQNHLYEGLCFIGNFTEVDTPSDEALSEAWRIIAASALPISGGHSELAVEGHGTACPGGWNTSLISESQPPLKPPFLTTARRFSLAMAVFMRTTPTAPHDVQEQAGELFDRYIVRLPRHD